MFFTLTPTASLLTDVEVFEMIEEEGIVVETVGDIAKVSIVAKSACDNCSASSVCHPGEQEYMEAVNPVGAKKGQKVKVVVAPQAYLKASIILYGIPMTVFVVAAILGKNLGMQYGTEANSDLWAFVAGIASMLISFLFIKRYNNKIEKTQQYKPIIIEILA
jgi:sigma-E factor negative regulatory protein RseC